MPELVVKRALAVEQARAEHHAGIVALMGASAGCFCRFWHFAGDDNAWQARCNRDAAHNRAELEGALANGEEQGLVALCEGEVVGWLKLRPAARMAKLATRRLYRALPRFQSPESGVWMIGCILVRPDARRRGVARALIAASVEAVRALGGRAIEALPRVPSAATRDDELWTGPLPCFLEAGFVHVDGPAAYPVVRFDLVGEDEPCGVSPQLS